MSERRFIFLVNHRAGHRKGTAIMERIRSWSVENRIDAEVLESREYGGYPEIESRLRSHEDTVIAVVGGDGTFRQVCQALRHTGAAFGIIPAGSGNGLALGTGIPKDTSAALELLLHGRAQWTDGLSVNGHFSCMLSGIGFDAAVAHEFARQRTRGSLTYARITLKQFFGARPYDFTIRTADSELSTRAFFISMANSNQFGNRITIAPAACVDDGLMDVLVVNEMGKWRIPFAVLQQIRRGDIDEGLFRRKDILYIRASEIELENRDDAPLHIDGDPAETSRTLKVRVLPRAFRLIRPSL